MLSAALDHQTSNRTLLEPWIARAQQDASRRVIVLVREDGSEDVVTAGRLLDEVVERRRGLQRLGLRRDDVAIVAIGHSLDLIATFLACIHAGIVPAIASAYVTEGRPIEPYANRLDAMVRAAAAAAMIAAPGHAETLRKGSCRVISTAEIADAAADAAPEPLRAVDGNLAFLQYTSGSSGLPKGIAHRHETVIRYIESKRRAQPITADDVVVSWLPLYHDLGLISGLLAPLVLGVPSILISPFHWVRAPAVLLQTIHRHRGTLCFMPNFALNHCAHTVRQRDMEGLDLSCWRALVCGGEPVRAESLELFARRFETCGFRHHALRAGYGMAEAVEGATVTPSGQPPRVEWLDRMALQSEQRARAAAPGSADALPLVSSGTANPGFSLCVVGDDGKEVDDLVVGEITIRGEFVLAGYYRQPEETQLALRNGWLYTGDLGYISKGELFVTGRKKDLIIVGGRNIQPTEIEDLADTVKGFRPGRCVAFGVYDQASGSERVVVVGELAQEASEDERLAIARELRRRSVQELDAPLGDVRLVEKGWVIKTSSGKHARPANREKYLRQFVAPTVA